MLLLLLLHLRLLMRLGIVHGDGAGWDEGEALEDRIRCGGSIGHGKALQGTRSSHIVERWWTLTHHIVEGPRDCLAGRSQLASCSEVHSAGCRSGGRGV